MPELDDMAYSREQTITAVRDYYAFLSRLYLKDSQVIFPPEGGWPSITTADPGSLASLGKTDEVLTLLAHLPYIRCPGNWNYDAEGAPGCVFADWHHEIESLTTSNGALTAEVLRTITEGVPFRDFAPAHVVGLTIGSGEHPIMVLDTRLGIILWESCPSDIEWNSPSTIVYDSEDYDEGDSDDSEYADDHLSEENGDEVDEDGDVEDDDTDDELKNEDEHKNDNHDKRDLTKRKKELEWRQGATIWAVPDFFEVLKDQFRHLRWIPLSQHKVWDASSTYAPDGPGMASMLQDIYRQHGWPDLDRYRKLECLAAVQKAVTERYPSFVDVR